MTEICFCLPKWKFLPGKSVLSREKIGKSDLVPSEKYSYYAGLCGSYYIRILGSRGGGGTDLERGYGDVRPWRPPFHASPAARKGPISSKRVSSQDPLLRKFGNFSLNSLNFHPKFSSQAPKFGNFQLTSPQIWKFSAHKPPYLEIFHSQAPLFRGKCQFASPTLRKSGPHTPTWNKVECPPPGLGYIYANAFTVSLLVKWCIYAGIFPCTSFLPFYRLYADCIAEPIKSITQNASAISCHLTDTQLTLDNHEHYLQVAAGCYEINALCEIYT